MLKLVGTLKLPLLVKVKVAAIIWFGESTVFSWFQTQVKEMLMLWGFQFVFAKVNVKGVVPAFFM